MKIVTVSERPDLTERTFERTYDNLREYNQHGDVLNRYWGRLTEERPAFQFHLVDDAEEISAGGVRLAWLGPATGDLLGTQARAETPPRSNPSRLGAET